MSVLIKGMKMPRHCGECGIEWCDRWKQLIIAGMSIAKIRPRDCPLIELPPHGRLIDADVLEDRCRRQARDKWNKSTGTNWGYAYATFESDVEDAPTIIEAEEGE